MEKIQLNYKQPEKIQLNYKQPEKIQLNYKQPEKIQVDYMFIHQYSATPLKVTITKIQNYYQVSVTNPGASDLTNYQLKLSGLGIESRNESWNTEYIPENFDKSMIFTNHLCINL